MANNKAELPMNKILDQTRKIEFMTREQFYKYILLFNPKTSEARFDYLANELIRQGLLFEEKRNGNYIATHPVTNINNAMVMAVDILLEFLHEDKKKVFIVRTNEWNGIDFVRGSNLIKTIHLPLTEHENYTMQQVRSMDDNQTTYIFMLDNPDDIAICDPITTEDSFAYREGNDMIFVLKE